MKKRDPRQIVTPFAFAIDPEVLGLPLASPRRRLLALLIDLIIASVISAVSLRSEEGIAALAFLLSILVFWLIIRIKTTGFFKRSFKYIGAFTAFFWSFILFASVFELSRPGGGDYSNWVTFSQNDEEIPEEVVANMDWETFGEKIVEQSQSDSLNYDEFFETLGDEIERAMDITYSSSNEIEEFEFPEDQTDNLRALSAAIIAKDTSAYDNLREQIVNVIAKPELDDFKLELQEADNEIDTLEAKVEELEEVVENPGFLRLLKSFANDLGLTFGSIGVYFILTMVMLKGRTPGKKLTGIQVVRLNGKPMNFLYAFERFGGYAAGLATGTFGFFQMIWDPNRQAIHDKIAGTVVIDTRDKIIEKYAHLTQEIRDEENLLSQMP